MNTISSDLDLKLEALSSEFRRLILGLVYTDGPIFQSDILKHVGVESNKLAYHLNILRVAGLINREYGRDGRKISTYSIKEDGIKFLRSIGAIDELNGLTKQKLRPPNRPHSIKSHRFSTAGYPHTSRLARKKRVLTA